MYALTLTPVDKMRLTDLIEKTTTEIPCPYDTIQLPIQTAVGAAKGNQYFYDFNQSDENNHRKRGRNDGGQKGKQARFQNIDQGTFHITISNTYLCLTFNCNIFELCREMLVLFVITIG